MNKIEMLLNILQEIGVKPPNREKKSREVLYARIDPIRMGVWDSSVVLGSLINARNYPDCTMGEIRQAGNSLEIWFTQRQNREDDSSYEKSLLQEIVKAAKKNEAK